MRSSSVTIIGGGVIGSSVAYHLAVRGCRDVVVLDRGSAPGGGSTGRATGGYRGQFGTAINVGLSLLARRKLLAFSDETGVDPGYEPAGYLWLASAEEELAALRASQLVQHSEGLREAVEVDRRDIAELNPAVRLDGVIGGVFCPTDGFIRPMEILRGYLTAAQRLGARVEWGVEVIGAVLDSAGRISELKTTNGAMVAGAVVNAAGAWCASLAGMAGVELPVTPLRRQVAITVPCDLLPQEMPMTIFAGDGFHLRVRDDRILLLWPTPGVPGEPFNTRVDPSWVELVVSMAHRRFPLLRETAVDRPRCWAGLYEMSPDRHAILGPAPGCANLYLINGSSGHGVMHAPALGQLLAEIICDGRASSLDVMPLRPTRFAEGAPNLVSELL